jgi:hypothetical protein
MAFSAFVPVSIPILYWGIPGFDVETMMQWKSISLGAVTITAQLPVLWLLSTLLGMKRSLIAVGIYLAIGQFYLPVFAGGLGADLIQQHTFGYVLAFLPATWVQTRLLKISKKLEMIWVSFLASWAVILVTGSGYEMISSRRFTLLILTEQLHSLGLGMLGLIVLLGWLSLGLLQLLGLLPDKTTTNQTPMPETIPSPL